MEQPRISQTTATRSKKIVKRRTQRSAFQSDNKQASSAKRLAKNFENSVGFSETNYSYSKSFASFKENDRIQVEIKDEHCEYDSIGQGKLEEGSKFPTKEKVERFKALLPDHLTTKLNPVYQNLLKVADEMDRILDKKSNSNNMECFENIQYQLRDELSLNINYDMLTQINFLIKDFYRYYREPLGHLVIGLKYNLGSLKMRKYLLRKELYCQILKNSQETISISSISHSLPASELQIKRLSTFYPIKNKFYQSKQCQKISKNFINKIDNLVKKQEQQLDQGMHEEQQSLCLFGIEEFIDRLAQFYSCHKVCHIYRASIVSLFQKQGMGTQRVLKWLAMIQKTGFYLHPKEMSSKTLIYELRPSQKTLLLKTLKPRI